MHLHWGLAHCKYSKMISLFNLHHTLFFTLTVFKQIAHPIRAVTLNSKIYLAQPYYNVLYLQVLKRLTIRAVVLDTHYQKGLWEVGPHRFTIEKTTQSLPLANVFSWGRPNPTRLAHLCMSSTFILFRNSTCFRKLTLSAKASIPKGHPGRNSHPVLSGPI